MDDLINLYITRYFTTLSSFGYKDYDSVNKLIILIFIQELLSSECKQLITEQEYLSIQNVLNCLYGSTCLVPYPEYLATSSLSCSGKPT